MHSPDESRDDDSFDALDRYLDALHAGREPDRQRVRHDHPEFVSALDCLDLLDRLALPLAGSSPALAPGAADSLHDAATFQTPRAAGLETPHSPRDAESLATAPEFGPYELIEEIGRGGMGVVFKARQKSLDRIVAIKMILSNHLASAEQVARFDAEARAAAKLHHPNIVSIHEFGQLHGQHYFVMEFVEGQNLADRLRAGPIDAETAAACVRSIARAVEHLHSQGIVHRDLKPANVLLSEAKSGVQRAEGQRANDNRNARDAAQALRPPLSALRPILSDFGLAKMLAGDSKMTQSGAIVGTPSYMAPEQATGRADAVGPRSDVYSLGAILYEMLTGQPPFRAATPLDTLVQVLEGEPAAPRQLLSSVPRDLELICLKCLEKSPDARYATAAALADDLDRYLNGEIVEARPAGFVQKMRRWSRREPALASRLGLLAICFIIAQLNFWLTVDTEATVHYSVLAVLGIWGLISMAFQRLLELDRWAGIARFAWAAADAVHLTAILMIVRTPEGPLLVVYPALVAASGLWFRVRIVWFMTGMAALSYLALLEHAKRVGPALQEPTYRPIIVLVVLVAVGFVVAYQVKRVRVLSRYYERRPLP